MNVNIEIVLFDCLKNDFLDLRIIYDLDSSMDSGGLRAKLETMRRFLQFFFSKKWSAL